MGADGDCLFRKIAMTIRTERASGPESLGQSGDSCRSRMAFRVEQDLRHEGSLRFRSQASGPRASWQSRVRRIGGGRASGASAAGSPQGAHSTRICVVSSRSSGLLSREPACSTPTRVHRLGPPDAHSWSGSASRRRPRLRGSDLTGQGRDRPAPDPGRWVLYLVSASDRCRFPPASLPTTGVGGATSGSRLADRGRGRAELCQCLNPPRQEGRHEQEQSEALHNHAAVRAAR